MVNSQEVIERSVYDSLLKTAMALGYTIDPNDYLPISPENQRRFDEDIKELQLYIQIFGTGNNQAKGRKLTPRIVVNARGFFPGNVGLPRQLIDKGVGEGFTVHEEPYVSFDQFIDIHLVADNQEHMRLLHQVLFYSIPQKGYIKPYTSPQFKFTGNIFIQLLNFQDANDLRDGIMEKIYQFEVQDTLISERVSQEDISPIRDIVAVMEDYNEVKKGIIHFPENNN